MEIITVNRVPINAASYEGGLYMLWTLAKRNWYRGDLGRLWHTDSINCPGCFHSWRLDATPLF